MHAKTLCAIGMMLAASGCASLPDGPSRAAYPGTGKTFDEFRADDAACRQYALESVGGKTAQQAAQTSAVETAAVGTAIGAVAGALIGGGKGAGVGAGGGLLVGSAIGANSAQQSGHSTQHRYDNAYMQCMYAKGEKVPVAGRFVPPPGAAYAPPYTHVAQPAQSLPPPPPPPPSAPAPATVASAKLFAYPQRDQSAEQQAQDRYECHSWAASQTGFDPSQPPSGGGTSAQVDGYRRAMGACLEARGYAVK